MSDNERPDDNEISSDLDPIPDLDETPEAVPVRPASPEDAPAEEPVNAAPEEQTLDELTDDELEGLVQLEETPRLRKVDDFTPDPRITMTTNPYAPLKRKVPAHSALHLMAVGLEEINEIIQDYQINFNDDETPSPKHIERVRAIIANLSDGLQTLYYRKTLSREDADWGQDVEVNGTKLRAGRAALKADADPVLRIRNQLGLGELVQIPLWHSGIWITFKTPSDSALLALESRISLEKATLGRQSNGMVFSSVEVYATAHILDFIFEHVHNVNLPNREPELLKDMILATDIPQLCWGILLSIYPAGYPLHQPCVVNPDKCEHVIEALINLGRLSWTDRNRLTDRQKKHMLQRTAVQSPEKIREYQSEFVFKEKASVEVNDRVSLRMRVPTIAQSINSGFAWVEGINNATQKAFSMKMGQNERDQYIQSQAMITSLRQYAHWFEAITSSNAEGIEETIDDAAAVDAILEVVCSSNAMTDKVYRAVLDFIDSCSITMIALPKWKCPKCQGEPDAEYLKHPHLIPLDVINVFFILRVQKVTGKLAAEGIRPR